MKPESAHQANDDPPNPDDHSFQNVLGAIIAILILASLSLLSAMDWIMRVVLVVAIIVTVFGLCFALGKFGNRFLQGIAGNVLIRIIALLILFGAVLPCVAMDSTMRVVVMVAVGVAVVGLCVAVALLYRDPDPNLATNNQPDGSFLTVKCPSCQHESAWDSKILQSSDVSVVVRKCPSCQHELFRELFDRFGKKQPEPEPEILSKRPCPKCGIRMLRFKGGFECPSCQSAAPPRPSPEKQDASTSYKPAASPPPSSQQPRPQGTTVPSDKPCPKCGKMLRKPDKSAIGIKCPSCQHEWESTQWGGFAFPNCGKCGQRLRVPLDKGTLTIRCPKCKWEQTDWQPPTTIMDGVKTTKHGPIMSGKYIWRSGAGDTLVNVIGTYGMGSDGRVYVKVEETTTGIPEDELVPVAKDS